MIRTVLYVDCFWIRNFYECKKSQIEIVFVENAWDPTFPACHIYPPKLMCIFALINLILGAQEAEVPGEAPPEGLYISNVPVADI